MSRHAPLLALCLLAGACSSRPQMTLDQSLQGKDPAERKEILRVACLDEAEFPQRSQIPAAASIRQRAHNGHFVDSRVGEMKDLCRKMDALAAGSTDKNPGREMLARDCAALVRKKQQDGGEGFSEHAERTQHICDEMLGQRIAAGK